MALIIPPHTQSPSLEGQQALGQSARAAGKQALHPAGTLAETANKADGGLEISDALRVQIRSLATAERNANDAISMVQTADVALDKMGGLLERMRDLAGSGTDEDRAELGTLREAIGKIQEGATYEGHSLLGPSEAQIGFDVGVDEGRSERITVTLGGLGLESALGATTQPSGTPNSGPSVVGRLDDALAAISSQRARFGATVSRFSEATSAVQTARASRTATTAPLEGVGMAEELANLCKTQMLDKPANAVQAQAQPLSKHLLSLLQD